ncbi:MAG: single-stranded DNA-binding protein [Planctomycetaceae bacterium]
MASFNKVVLMGNLTRDPEVRYTPGGSAVTDVGLAVNRQWFDKNANERKEEVTFVTVTLWGRTAEIAGEYLSKGRPVLIEGRLQMDTWQDKETDQNRSKLKVVGENMTLLPSGGSGGGAPSRGPQGGPHHNQAPASHSQPTQQSHSAPSPDQAFYDNPPAGPPADDVPF